MKVKIALRIYSIQIEKRTFGSNQVVLISTFDYKKIATKNIFKCHQACNQACH